MRLDEITRGDSVRSRALISFISLVSGMRLPDAARVAFYDKGFVAGALGAWTQAAMRGPSDWSIGERELMAAMVATWNGSAFCMGAHRATAGKRVSKATVDAAMQDYRKAGLASRLEATLTFLEKLTQTPDDVTADDARRVLAAGVSTAALHDAAAVCAIFNMISRYADALQFDIPTDADYDKAADMLLKRGYA